MIKLSIAVIFLCVFNINYLPAQYTNVLIDNAFAPEEPSITINLLNPNLMAAGSNMQNAYYSVDGGATWITTLFTSTFSNAGDPCLTADSLGNILYFHLVSQVDRVVCQSSANGGVTYTNGSFAWSNSGLFEDKEWATVDPHTNNLYVTWTEYDNGFNPGPQDSSRIFFSKSTDNGITFTNGVKINQISGDCLYLDITDPHPFVGPNGEVYITFMDSAGIRFSKSTDFGDTWLSTPSLIENISAPYRYNSIAGVSRIRSMPYSACDRSTSPYRGNLYVSWADQRNGISNSDVFFIKSNDGGNTWTNAMKINSDSTDRQQFRCAMTVDQTSGFIYIVYYDRRNYSGNDSTDVYLAKSMDGGDHWTDIKINNNGFYNDGNVFDGDYIDIAAHAGIVRPIWTTIDNFSPGIWTCLYNEPTTGISNISTSNLKTNFSVNPNPANVIAMLSFSKEVTLKGIITDASGRKLKSFALNHESEKLIDIHDLSPGIYFIKAGETTQKLIVEK
jgi:hypothetical protein